MRQDIVPFIQTKDFHFSASCRMESVSKSLSQQMQHVESHGLCCHAWLTAPHCVCKKPRAQTAGMSNLLYLTVAADLTVLVAVDDSHGIERIELTQGSVPSQARNMDEVRPSLTDAGLQLIRAISRLVGSSRHSDEVVQQRLQRLLRSWRRTRPCAAILQHAQNQNAPRLFVDHVGCNLADVSWELLGRAQTSAAFFEVGLFGYGNRKPRKTRSEAEADADPLQRLGTFAAPGGGSARSFQLQRLEPLRWHRVKVRAVGLHKSWVSDWSNEVSFRTLSLQDAQDAGLRIASEGFLVKSERLIQKCVTNQNVSLPSREERMVRRVRQLLGASQSYEAATTKLLHARYSQGGWPDFVKQGAKFSRPAASRDERMKRMQLAIAAEELYGPVYPRGNEWCQGPFYYESAGLKTLSRRSS